jgi:hypothetical protein
MKHSGPLESSISEPGAGEAPGGLARLRARRSYLNSGFWAAALLLALLLLVSPAAAQRTDTPYDKNLQWFSYAGDHQVAGKWGIHFDGGWRQMNNARWSQWLLRPGVNYQLSPNVQISGAYSYFSTHPGGLDWKPGAAPEHRWQEQVLIQQPLGKLNLSHRFRFDHRFLGSEFAEGHERTWNLQHRVRYMLRGDIPLRRLSNEKTAVSLVLFNEFFLRYGYAGVSAFEQNRLYAGLALRTANSTGFDVGVFNQRFQPMTGGRIENNYVLIISVSNQLPLNRLLRRK